MHLTGHYQDIHHHPEQVLLPQCTLPAITRIYTIILNKYFYHNTPCQPLPGYTPLSRTSTFTTIHLAGHYLDIHHYPESVLLPQYTLPAITWIYTIILNKYFDHNTPYRPLPGYTPLSLTSTFTTIHTTGHYQDIHHHPEQVLLPQYTLPAITWIYTIILNKYFYHNTPCRPLPGYTPLSRTSTFTTIHLAGHYLDIHHHPEQVLLPQCTLPAITRIYTIILNKYFYHNTPYRPLPGYTPSS